MSYANQLMEVMMIKQYATTNRPITKDGAMQADDLNKETKYF